jgi:hypothetical protein
MRVFHLIAAAFLILACVTILPVAAAAQTGMSADGKAAGVVFLPYSGDLINSTGMPDDPETDALTWHLVKHVSHYMTGAGDVKTWPTYYANRAGKTRIIMTSPLGTYFTLCFLYRGKWYKSPVPGNYAIAQMYMKKGEPYRLRVKSNSGSGLADVNVYRKY